MVLKRIINPTWHSKGDRWSRPYTRLRSLRRYPFTGKDSWIVIWWKIFIFCPGAQGSPLDWIGRNPAGGKQMKKHERFISCSCWRWFTERLAYKLPSSTWLSFATTGSFTLASFAWNNMIILASILRLTIDKLEVAQRICPKIKKLDISMFNFSFDDQVIEMAVVVVADDVEAGHPHIQLLLCRPGRGHGSWTQQVQRHVLWIWGKERKVKV